MIALEQGRFLSDFCQIGFGRIGAYRGVEILVFGSWQCLLQSSAGFGQVKC